MKFEAVDEFVAEAGYTPFTSPAAGKMLYEFVLNSGVRDLLELGFAQGTSTVYMAAALQERGEGLVTTIDRATALERKPNLPELARALALEEYVRPIVVENTYTWELMRLIERQTERGETVPCFDFCFFDGAHTWETDGLAFFLVDKLLRHDRWVLFDDLHWTQASSPFLTEEKAGRVPTEELETPQMKQVFDLLVRQHADYVDFRVLGNYGWAYKADPSGGGHSDDLEALSGETIFDLAFGAVRARSE